MNQSASELSAKERFDHGPIIVGAGFGGPRMLLELRKLGIPTCLLEAGTNVGGTWCWNKYPGARTDSEFSVYTCRSELRDERRQRRLGQPRSESHHGWALSRRRLAPVGRRSGPNVQRCRQVYREHRCA